MTERDQFGTQLDKVVDLAVERDPDRVVLVRQGLAGRIREVDDGQPAMAEDGGAVPQEIRPVRPPGRLGVEHPPDGEGIPRRGGGVQPEEPRDPAHGQTRPRRRSGVGSP